MGGENRGRRARRVVWLDCWYHKPLAILVDARTVGAAIAEALARVDDEVELADGLPELVAVELARCGAGERRAG
jgi:hypothetical protein